MNTAPLVIDASRPQKSWPNSSGGVIFIKKHRGGKRKKSVGEFFDGFDASEGSSRLHIAFIFFGALAASMLWAR